ncbi:MAG: DNA/RNA nuclease SfsA [Marinilabiliales bacterium]|nr:MAG: DNA/RNA nuclease SfsA [Marinilabiliales bacterium]
MKFEKKLVKGKLIRRYKRFLSDIELENGEQVIAHCTNSGSMKTCLEEGADVYLSPVNDPKRKTKFTWEMIFINNAWIGINTMVPNKLAYDAISNGEIDKLRGYTNVRREVKFGDSRFDIYAENDHEKCFVEVKNVTMKVGDSALFPDAVSSRGRKHLETLIEVKKSGIRAVMLYVVQRMDVEFFGLAEDIDPAYASSLRKAIKHGVELIAVQAKASPERIQIVKELEVKY